MATIRAKQRIPKSEIDVMYRGLVGQVQAAVKSVAALQEEERQAGRGRGRASITVDLAGEAFRQPGPPVAATASRRGAGRLP